MPSRIPVPSGKHPWLIPLPTTCNKPPTKLKRTPRLQPTPKVPASESPSSPLSATTVPCSAAVARKDSPARLPEVTVSNTDGSGAKEEEEEEEQEEDEEHEGKDGSDGFVQAKRERVQQLKNYLFPSARERELTGLYNDTMAQLWDAGAQLAYRQEACRAMAELPAEDVLAALAASRRGARDLVRAQVGDRMFASLDGDHRGHFGLMALRIRNLDGCGVHDPEAQTLWDAMRAARGEAADGVLDLHRRFLLVLDCQTARTKRVSKDWGV